MKSYIQGIITGGVMVFAFMVLVGQTGNNKKIKEDIWDLQDSIESLEKNLNRLKKEVRNKKVTADYGTSASINTSGIGRFQLFVGSANHAYLFDTRTGEYYATKEKEIEQFNGTYKTDKPQFYKKGDWEDKPIVAAHPSALNK